VTTFNPADKSTSITLSGGNLTATGDSSSSRASVRGTTSKTSGTWRWKFTINTFGSDIGIGIANASFAFTSYPGRDADAVGYFGSGYAAYNDSGGGPFQILATYAGGAVLEAEVNFTAQTVTFFKDGAQQGTAFSPGATFFSNPLFPLLFIVGSGDNVTADFTNWDTVSGTLAPAAAAITLTGATSRLTTTLAPAAASIALAGATPTVTSSTFSTLTPAAASIALSGATPSLKTTVYPGYGLFQDETGQPVRDENGLPIFDSTPRLSLVVAGATPAVTLLGNIAPTAAAITLTGLVPTIGQPAGLLPAKASITLAGLAPALTTQVVPAPAAIAVAGETPVIINSQPVTPSPAAITLAGLFPLVSNTVQILMPATCDITVSGFVPTVSRGALPWRPLRGRPGTWVHVPHPPHS
jgi:hypothetical protein